MTGWRHERIRLQPDSDRPEFETIEFLVGDGDDGLTVVAEMLMVLSAGSDGRAF